MEIIVNTENLYNRISNLLKISREQTIRAINTTMVTTYFEIGRLIVEEEQNGKLLWENVFVQQVFDRNGAAIGGDDGTTPAQRVNIYMEKERVADFYAALAQGSLRVVKAEDADRQEE